jgi:hypothetical protein
MLDKPGWVRMILNVRLGKERWYAEGKGMPLAW